MRASDAFRQAAHTIWEANYAHASNEYQEIVRWLRALFDGAAADVAGALRARPQEIFDTSSRWEYLFWEMAWRMEGWPV